MTVPSDPPSPPGTIHTDRQVWALAFAETLVWAGMFYLFPALIAHWEADLGWAKTTISGAFTAALLTSAASAPLAGRLIDAGHGRLLLTGGGLAGGLLIGLVSFVQAPWQFYVLWIGLGAAMAGCLYEPCFAYLTRIRGGDARRAITRITLVAGLAGTVSFPTANLLAEIGGWRSATLAFAGIIILVAVPLMRYGTRTGPGVAETPSAVPTTGPEGPALRSGLRAAMAGPVFWMLAVSFSMIALTHGILITHLLPMMAERGVSVSIAVLAASGIGPMQVAGRIAMVMVERHLSMEIICAVSFVFMLAASGALIAAGALPALLVLFVLLQGSGYGVTSITRPVVTASLLGRLDFGAISGALALPFMAATALAPTLAALIWSVGGYDTVRLVVLGLVALGGLSFLAALALARRGTKPS